MSALLQKLGAGPLLALLTATTYRAALGVLGGSPTDGHVQCGLALSMFAALAAWAHAFRRIGGAS